MSGVRGKEMRGIKRVHAYKSSMEPNKRKKKLYVRPIKTFLAQMLGLV